MGAARARLAKLAIGLMLAYAVLHHIQRAVLFPRGLLRPDDRALESTPGIERWWLDSDDARVEAWWIPGAGVSPERPAPAVIFAHGNGELIDYWVQPLTRYRELGVSVLLVEYRGYGRSSGSPSEPGIRADFLRYYDRLAARDDVREVVLHGRSLGGGAVLTLVPERRVAAVVLESTFTSVPDVVPWIPRVLFADRFENERALAALDAPVLIFHGRRDEVVPYTHAVRLRDAAPAAELVTYECGHNDLPPNRHDYWSHIERLLSRVK